MNIDTINDIRLYQLHYDKSCNDSEYKDNTNNILEILEYDMESYLDNCVTIDDTIYDYPIFSGSIIVIDEEYNEYNYNNNSVNDDNDTINMKYIFD